MNELLVIGGTIGGLYYIQQASVGVTQEQHAGTAVTSAMTTLLMSRPLAGVAWQQQTDHPLSANANYTQMRDAMVGQFGRMSGATIAPKGLTNDQLAEIATKWLRAYDAGRAADAQNFAFTNDQASSNFGDSGGWLTGQGSNTKSCATTSTSDRTPLGNAACELASWRDQLGSAFTDPEDDTIELFRLVNRLASEMDGADYTWDGVRNSDQGWKFGDIPGGIGAAASATASFVEGLAGDAAGALGGAIVGSDLFWLAALAFAGYMVLR